MTQGRGQSTRLNDSHRSHVLILKWTPSPQKQFLIQFLCSSAWPMGKQSRARIQGQIHAHKKYGSEVCLLYGSDIIYVQLTWMQTSWSITSACHNGRGQTCRSLVHKAVVSMTKSVCCSKVKTPSLTWCTVKQRCMHAFCMESKIH